MKATTGLWLAAAAAVMLFSPAPASADDLRMCRRSAKASYKAERLVCLAAAGRKTGGTNAGTTLAASKTIDVCLNGDGSCTYSGEVSVWNTGAGDTLGCAINDKVECKNASGPNWTLVASSGLGCSGPLLDGNIPAATDPPGYATSYSFTGSCCTTTARNNAEVTITNHSNYIGTPFGPNPKATFLGDLANLPSCSRECGCTYTRGYWTSKPGVEWPAPYDRNASFFSSGLTWQQVLTTPASGNGYIILGAQYIAAVLNVANKACHPDGVQDILDQSESFFNGTTTPSAACPSPSSCGLQKSWATILDNYNNGLYPGGPAHCGDE